MLHFRPVAISWLYLIAIRSNGDGPSRRSFIVQLTEPVS